MSWDIYFIFSSPLFPFSCVFRHSLLFVILNIIFRPAAEIYMSFMILREVRVDTTRSCITHNNNKLEIINGEREREQQAVKDCSLGCRMIWL